VGIGVKWKKGWRFLAEPLSTSKANSKQGLADRHRDELQLLEVA